MTTNSRVVKAFLYSLLTVMCLLLIGLVGSVVAPNEFHKILNCVESNALLLTCGPDQAPVAAPIPPIPPIPDPTPRNLTFELLDHTVRVRVGNSSATGVILWRGQSPTTSLFHTLIITNSHAMQGQTQAEIDTFIYVERKTIACITSFSGSLVQKSDELDLALLEVRSPTPFGNPAELISLQELEAVSLNDPITVCGCGLGNPPYITQGNLAIYDDHRHLITAFSIFGNSGGGAYTTSGKLFALVVGVMAVEVGTAEESIIIPEPNLAQAIPSFVMARWLQLSKFKFIIGEGTAEAYFQSTSRKTRYNFY